MHGPTSAPHGRSSARYARAFAAAVLAAAALITAANVGPGRASEPVRTAVQGERG